MTSIYLIIIVLATTALAKGSTECVFSEATDGRQYFAEEGQTLCFYLANITNMEMRLQKDDEDLILKVKNQEVLLIGTFAESRTQVIPNLSNSGSINLGEATKSHSGKYTLEKFLTNGTLLNKVTVQLIIQGPVSQPDVSYTCLSPDQIMVSCSSKEEGVEFSVSLDDHLLINTSNQSPTPTNCGTNIQSVAKAPTEEDSSVSHVTICLSGEQVEQLTCKVWNKVSKRETIIRLTDCKDFISSFPVATVAVVAAVVLLLLVAVCLGINKLHRKPRITNANKRNPESDVIYTEVKVIRNISP